VPERTEGIDELVPANATATIAGEVVEGLPSAMELNSVGGVEVGDGGSGILGGGPCDVWGGT